MSQQALDLRRSLQLVRRYRNIVGFAAALGLVAGAVYTALHPPMLATKALVALPPTVVGIAGPPARDLASQVVIATSDPVLAKAMRHVTPAVSLATLRGRVQVTSVTTDILAIGAQGTTAAQAEDIANAVADSYVSFISSPGNPDGWVQESATTAAGTPLARRLLVNGGLGALLGALAGTIVALAIGRNDRRLRERDEIAGAIGVPVLASIPVGHPSDTAGWAKLLEDYDPGVVHAWSLRKALHDLGLTDVRGGSVRGGSGASVAIVSLSSDPGALALGPQLAAFASSLGIPTALVIGPRQDADATATLRAACTARPAMPSGRSSHLRVTVGDHEDVGGQPDAALTVAVAVVDGRAPRVADTMRTTATVLGVSAGAATAEQLTRVAVRAADDGRDIAGVIVADPDPADHTTGRLLQPAQQTLPTRLTGTVTENRR